MDSPEDTWERGNMLNKGKIASARGLLEEKAVESLLLLVQNDFEGADFIQDAVAELELECGHTPAFVRDVLYATYALLYFKLVLNRRAALAGEAVFTEYCRNFFGDHYMYRISDIGLLSLQRAMARL